MERDVGFFKKISGWTFGAKRQQPECRGNSIFRSCKFEELEPRRVLSADPVIAGLTYFEGDLGQDTTPDYFEVTFQGGSATTQLTQFTINGDQDGNANLNDGDIFFDVTSSQPGAGGHAGFQFNMTHSSGIAADDILSVHVSPDGLLMSVDVKNFEAGDVLAFTADVDEAERFRTDKIASGVEFEGTRLEATFSDAHHVFVEKSISIEHVLDEGFQQQQVDGFFYDEYDELIDEGSRLAGQDLVLTYDNQTGYADRSAAAILGYDLNPLPISISGNVFHDLDLECGRDSDGTGIEGVAIELQKLSESGQYEPVAATQTDVGGHYEFGHELGLAPGTYRLIEVQPEGYLDLGATAGQVGDSEVGTVSNDANQDANIISDISIPFGNNAATNYNFCEVRSSSLSGHVWHDRNDNGTRDAGEEGIANVSIRVMRSGPMDGVASDPFHPFSSVVVQTNGEGFFLAEALPPGIYEIREVNHYPTGHDPLAQFVDGKETIGTVDGERVGVKSNDRFQQIMLGAGQHGVQYDFGELRQTIISGYVSVTSSDGECVDPLSNEHRGMEGVVVHLYTTNRTLVESTQTNSDGFYEFDQLAPGTYGIVEVQPSGYLDGGDSLGRVDGELNGVVRANDRFNAIRLASGQSGTMYNFCEQLPAEIGGAVWHDANNNGLLEMGESGISSVLVQLFNAHGTQVSQQLTDAQGNYCFAGLEAGEYSVSEIQPAGFIDGQEMLGTVVSTNGTSTQVGLVQNDQFEGIVLLAGDRGQNYSFGEFQTEKVEDQDLRFDREGGGIPAPIIASGNPLTPIPGITTYPGLAGSQPGLTFEIGGSSGGAFQVPLNQQPYTWHLSVVNAGQPRSVAEATAESSTVWRQVAALKESDWSRFTMVDANWSFTKTLQAGELVQSDSVIRYGMLGGTPVVGDFDGDGVDEIAVFHEGFWLIDINRNGQWDSEDLLARLGGEQDRPVVGDWDGDGKEDIGIYGPMWPKDIEAINQEPGLPNPENTPFTRPKNIPPTQTSASEGTRIMKLTSYGQQRVDLVDHVFGIGAPEDVPVAGDWNGNGVRSIGKFNEGLWHLDVNGDGEFNQQDAVINFGQSGDYPVTGDFNGDGIEEIAVYRAGTWLIDINGNRQLDAADMNFEMGETGDIPIVGDWDGDGIDEPGLYRESQVDQDRVD